MFFNVVDIVVISIVCRSPKRKHPSEVWDLAREVML